MPKQYQRNKHVFLHLSRERLALVQHVLGEYTSEQLVYLMGRLENSRETLRKKRERMEQAAADYENHKNVVILDDEVDVFNECESIMLEADPTHPVVVATQEIEEIK